MSLVSDMLSKVNLPQPTRETPPGLRSDIHQARQRKVAKKYKVALVISVVAAFMIIVSAMLFRIYVIKSGEHIPADLHKLKTRHKERLAKQQSSQSLSEKIEEALKEPPKGSPQPENKGLFGKTPPPILVAAAAIEGDTSADEGSTDDKLLKALGAIKPAVEEEASADDAAIDDSPAVEEDKEPVIGSKETFHLLYKAVRSEKKNDYLDAINIYKKILVIEPENHIIMNKIASLLMKMNMWKEAMGELRDSYKLKEDYMPALINIGIVYANTGNYSRSEKYLLKALATDPINVNAIFSIALLYEKQTRFDKAADYYTRLQKLGDERGGAGLERVLNN